MGWPCQKAWAHRTGDTTSEALSSWHHTSQPQLMLPLPSPWATKHQRTRTGFRPTVADCLKAQTKPFDPPTCQLKWPDLQPTIDVSTTLAQSGEGENCPPTVNHGEQQNIPTQPLKQQPARLILPAGWAENASEQRRMLVGISSLSRLLT